MYYYGPGGPGPEPGPREQGIQINSRYRAIATVDLDNLGPVMLVPHEAG